MVCVNKLKHLKQMKIDMFDNVLQSYAADGQLIYKMTCIIHGNTINL